MQSTMTEKEFEKAVVEEVRKIDGGRPWSVTEIAKAVARKAGLEFALEPVKLPELIALSAPDKHDPFLPNHGTILNGGVRIAIIPIGWSEAASVRECRVILGGAVTRYNAYPGLRAAAQRLHAVLGTMIVAGQTNELLDAWRALEAELAKGPKS